MLGNFQFICKFLCFFMLADDKTLIIRSNSPPFAELKGRPNGLDRGRKAVYKPETIRIASAFGDGIGQNDISR